MKTTQIIPLAVLMVGSSLALHATRTQPLASYIVEKDKPLVVLAQWAPLFPALFRHSPEN